MICISSEFPFQNGTLNGFLTYLKQNSMIDYFVTSTVYPQHSNFFGSNCIDRNPSTICHTTNTVNENKYFMVHLKNVSFKVEGYSFQNRNIVDNNPNNWVFEGSNDGSTFHELDNQTTTSQCAPGIIRSFPITTDLTFYYFRMVFYGKSCNNDYYFNIAEFELFGNIYVPSNHKSCTCLQVVTLVFPLIFVFCIMISN